MKLNRKPGLEETIEENLDETGFIDAAKVRAS